MFMSTNKVDLYLKCNSLKRRYQYQIYQDNNSRGLTQVYTKNICQQIVEAVYIQPKIDKCEEKVWCLEVDGQLIDDFIIEVDTHHSITFYNLLIPPAGV